MELEFNNRYLTFAHFLEHFCYNTVIHIFICCFFWGLEDKICIQRSL